VTNIKHGATNPEQRNAARFDTRQPLWFEGQDRRMAAESRNMSSTGMFVVSEHAHDIGSQVQVSFADPDAGDVSLQMEVVWKDTPAEGTPTKMGLRVISLGNSAAAFEQFVNRHLQSDRNE